MAPTRKVAPKRGATSRKWFTPIVFYWVLAIIALLGLADAAFLTVAHLTGDDAVCGTAVGCSTEGGADALGERGGFRVGVIAGAGPEEPAQPVLAVAGHDVDVEVRHALADAVVDRHKRALGAETLLHRPREQPRVTEELGQLGVG